MRIWTFEEAPVHLVIKLFGREVLSVDTEADQVAERGDATSEGFGFSSTTPQMTAGRYGIDDPQPHDDRRCP